MEAIIIAITGFVVLIVFLVTLHELGHYLTGRAFGLIPKSFSVGMGQELYAIEDKHGTRWKLSALPIGGYVQFAGEMHPGAGTEEDRKDPNNFASLTRWKRACIIAAGPITNLIIAALIFLAIGFANGKVEINPQIDSIELESPAEKAGLTSGDIIKKWNDQNPDNLKNMIRHIAVHPKETLSIEYERDGSISTALINIAATQKTDDFGNEYIIGTAGIGLTAQNIPINSVSDAFEVSIGETVNLFKLQTNAMVQIITGKRSPKEISGPIRMAKMTGEQISLGWLQVSYFAALLSIAIAFMNLLPVPGLDGGYLALYAVEAIKGKDISKLTLMRITKGGYAAIAILMIFAITNDVIIVLTS